MYDVRAVFENTYYVKLLILGHNFMETRTERQYVNVAVKVIWLDEYQHFGVCLGARGCSAH